MNNTCVNDHTIGSSLLRAPLLSVGLMQCEIIPPASPRSLTSLTSLPLADLCVRHCQTHSHAHASSDARALAFTREGWRRGGRGGGSVVQVRMGWVGLCLKKDRIVPKQNKPGVCSRMKPTRWLFLYYFF